MEKHTMVYLLGWLAINGPILVSVLTALVPVMAIGLAAYTVYLTAGKSGKK